MASRLGRTRMIRRWQGLAVTGGRWPQAAFDTCVSDSARATHLWQA